MMGHVVTCQIFVHHLVSMETVTNGFIQYITRKLKILRIKKGGDIGMV